MCVCVAKEFVLACSLINCRQSGVLFALILSDAYTFDIPSIDAVKWYDKRVLLTINAELLF